MLGRQGDRDVIHGHARDVAERIPNARYLEFDGDDSVWFAGDADFVLDEIESFLTGVRGAKPSNRVLSTVLFTDDAGPDPTNGGMLESRTCPQVVEERVGLNGDAVGEKCRPCLVVQPRVRKVKLTADSRATQCNRRPRI